MFVFNARKSSSWSAEDNEPVHTSQAAVAEAAKCGFKLLPHAPYSSNLAPSDFSMSPKLKSLCGDDAMHVVEEYLKAQNVT